MCCTADTIECFSRKYKGPCAWPETLTRLRLSFQAPWSPSQCASCTQTFSSTWGIHKSRWTDCTESRPSAARYVATARADTCPLFSPPCLPGHTPLIPPKCAHGLDLLFTALASHPWGKGTSQVLNAIFSPGSHREQMPRVPVQQLPLLYYSHAPSALYQTDHPGSQKRITYGLLAPERLCPVSGRSSTRLLLGAGVLPGSGSLTTPRVVT